MPGNITKSRSEFDGTERIIMTPAFLCNEGMFGPCLNKLGLLRSSNMAPGEVYISVEVTGTTAIYWDNSLQFNIDGEKTSLSSFDTTTRFGFDNQTRTAFSARSYKTDKQFIERLLAGRRVAVRIVTQSGVTEGVFSQDIATSARPAFREFYNLAFPSVQ